MVKRKASKVSKKAQKFSKKSVGIVLAIALVVGVVGISASANLSFNELFANVAGTILGNRVADQIDIVELTDKLSGASGPDKYFMQNFLESFTSGGSSSNASTTLTSALTLTAKQVCNNSYIHVNSAAVAGTIAAASLDITFPATSTLFRDCLNYPGAEKVLTFRNNSPTTASSTELIAGTGCDARISEATGADDTIDGLNEARVTIRRTDDAFADGGSVDCIVLIEETVVD